jgi:DNA-binding response OmpR family regulator
VTPTCVLVVDDDADTRGLVRTLLEREGHAVVEASDGRTALRVMHQERLDLVLLDVAMPGLDGFAVLERIRDVSEVPVLMLTAHSRELDKVRGLRAGADDYVGKPFGRQELLARLHALLRRTDRSSGEEDEPATYVDTLLTVDFRQKEVRLAGERIELTPQEHRLLEAFVRHPGQLLSHEQLADLAWGAERAATREQVRLYVGYLRRKLGFPARKGGPLETVRGFGFRYRPPS